MRVEQTVRKFIAIDGLGRYFIASVDIDKQNITGSKPYYTVKGIDKLEKFIESIKPDVIYISQVYDTENEVINNIIARHNVIPLSPTIARGIDTFSMRCNGTKLSTDDSYLDYCRAVSVDKEAALTIKEVIATETRGCTSIIDATASIVRRMCRIYNRGNQLQKFKTIIRFDDKVTIKIISYAEWEESEMEQKYRTITRRFRMNDEDISYDNGIRRVIALSNSLKDNMAVTQLRRVERAEEELEIEITYRLTDRYKQDEEYIISKLKQYYG